MPADAAARRRAVERRAAPARPARRAPVAAAARRRGEGRAPVSTDACRAFDICDPLPTGTTLLEASAGTGKTWTIGALVTRYVAEGVVTLDADADRHLRPRRQPGAPRTGPHPARRGRARARRARVGDRPQRPRRRCCSTRPTTSCEERRQRLRDALGAFDGATIATTHQFCHLVLRSLGVAGDTDANATLVEDLEDLLGEVVDDLYLSSLRRARRPPPFSHADALAPGRGPRPATRRRGWSRPTPIPSTGPGQRVAFARDGARRARPAQASPRRAELRRPALPARRRADRRRRRPPAQRMRRRWQVVLVDEFQDTDPVQWKVLDRAFTGHATMVLIGDPKQAIYAFRGGDVTTYLQAAATATTRKTLAVNWRSDSAPARLAADGPARRRARRRARSSSATSERTTRAAGSTGAGAPFRLRVVRKDVARRSAQDEAARSGRSGRTCTTTWRATSSGCSPPAPPSTGEPLAAARRRRHRLQEQRPAAGAAGARRRSACPPSSPAAAACSRPRPRPTGCGCSRRSSSRTAPPGSAVRRSRRSSGAPRPSSTRRGTHSPTGSPSTARDWAELFASRGVAAVLEAAVIAGLTARVLSRRRRRAAAHRPAARRPVAAPVGHRRAARSRRPADLAAGADGRRQGRGRQRAHPPARQRRGRGPARDDPRQQGPGVPGRLPADAVGPLPAGPDRFRCSTPTSSDGGHRCIDVGRGGPAVDRRTSTAPVTEDDGESLRLLYVAMTRARSQVVAWWAPAPKNAPRSPLHRMLFGRAPGESQVPREQPVPSEDDVVRSLAAWRDAGGPARSRPGSPTLADGDLAVGRAAARRAPVHPVGRHVLAPDVVLRAERRGRRAASRPPRRQRAGGAAEGRRARARRRARALGDRAAAAETRCASPMARLPVGATFGSLVHAVLEHADPRGGRPARRAARADPRAAGPLAGRGRRRRARRRAGRWSATARSDRWPTAARCARSVLRDRLCEMDFELPLAGGDVRGYPAAAVDAR